MSDKKLNVAVAGLGRMVSSRPGKGSKHFTYMSISLTPEI